MTDVKIDEKDERSFLDKAFKGLREAKDDKDFSDIIQKTMKYIIENSDE